MALHHLLIASRSNSRAIWGPLGSSGPAPRRLAHLGAMANPDADPDGLEPVITLAELADQLGVSVQTLYDLRRKGEGPRVFRVGRELRVRRTEVTAWLQRLEERDAERRTGERS